MVSGSGMDRIIGDILRRYADRPHLPFDIMSALKDNAVVDAEKRPNTSAGKRLAYARAR